MFVCMYTKIKIGYVCIEEEGGEEEEGFKSVYTMLKDCKCDKPQITCKNRFKGGFKVKKTAKRMSRFIETFLRLFVSH